MKRIVLISTLAALSIITALALMQDGLWNIFAYNFLNFGEFQVFFDLVIALGLFLGWMWGDATSSGRNPWPWMLLTLSMGSFGPLIYLLWYKTGRTGRL
ncbi:MAG TPA: DUF2834 domain-containing protein [Desulfobacteraceae bacterium]|nr:DUF2834 domain-containing protein [Desulfobacteraceae bacterium]